MENATRWKPSPQVFGGYFAHVTVEDQGRQVQSLRDTSEDCELVTFHRTWPPTPLRLLALMSCAFFTEEEQTQGFGTQN